MLARMSLRQKLLTIGAVVIVALIIAVLTGLVGIREGVSGVKELARRISAGQLGVDVQIGGGDRSSLLFAIKTMRDRLAGILREIEECSRHIGQSAYPISDEISGASRQLGSRSDEVSGAMLQLHQISAEVRSQAAELSGDPCLSAGCRSPHGGAGAAQRVCVNG